MTNERIPSRDEADPRTPRAGETADPAPLSTGPGKMRVLIGGASGMIGTEVMRQLEDAGHTVLRLVRRQPRTENEFTWTPAAEIVDTTLIDRVDAVINLSGASISRLPWTAPYKKKLLESRISATQTLVTAMHKAGKPPAVFLSGSAVGFYGDRPGEKLHEGSPAGAGFLAGVVETWERAARTAPEDTRVVLLRTGLVLGDAGALRPIRLLTKAGLAGPLGTGGQHWPWISLHDEAAAIVHLLGSNLAGPVNLAGPTPATADRLMRHLAKRLHRPYLLPVPEPVISAVLGDAGRDLLLPSQKIRPERLLRDGFRFTHSTVEEAVDAALASPG